MTIVRSMVSCAGVFSFTALGMLLGARAGAGLAKAEERLSAPVALAAAGRADRSLSHDSPQDSPQAQPRPDEGSRRVFKDRVSPHWFHDNTRFWYRNDLRGGTAEFIVVDAERGTRAPAFDHPKLAAALAKAAGVEYRAAKLPFDSIEFIHGSGAIRFKVGDTNWKCDLVSYECVRVSAPASTTPALETTEGSEAEAQRATGRGQRREERSDTSPDGQWTAFVKDHDVYLKSRDDDANQLQLSHDGKEGMAYGRFSWAPDSKTLVAFRIEPGERKEVYLIQSSPPGGGRATPQSRPYALPGDKCTTYELNVFDVTTRKQIKPEVDRFEHEWLVPRLRWNRAGHRFAYQQADRGHQRFRVIEVDARSRQVRNLIDERAKTFIWTSHAENLNLNVVNWLERTDEIIYASESNGWRHLYLIDAAAGKLKNPITAGEWVVRGIDLIDETNRQVWFRASGVHPNQDPYLVHCGRANFDGSGRVLLTEGNGNHSVQYSPDGSSSSTPSRAWTCPR